MRKISIEMSQFLLATMLFFSSTYWERVMMFVKGFQKDIAHSIYQTAHSNSYFQK